ncbi:hypothetical protein NEMIN01_0709 [Nematocida minor]|uniref:uncharacterized protein n=1 Tax=Nematocida minor TaxID=1912983 RepID=UPI00221FF232|nr:uncharacterized protein NEMIN01_0709 [Nematocida minor]KAI5189846.1 hypothetical protein NEMIN01_0709 [Nematocida minor]
MSETAAEERTEKQIFISSISNLLANPTEKTMGEVKKMTKILLKKKEKGTPRLVVLALAKVFFNLLPSYNIRTADHKYNSSSKITNYEYILMQEWQAYLKMITRSKTEESFEAAAILLPQAILFNKSMKLVGKVVKGTGMKNKIGRKCQQSLVQIFKCDKGNRIVKILEVINQMNIEKLPKETIKTLFYISDEALTKPENTERLAPAEMRKLSVEEKAIKKEAQLHFMPEEIKAWKGINERLLRIYLLILTTKPIEKHYYALSQMQRLRIPGNLKEGIFTVITQKVAELKENLTPRRAAVLAVCYMTLHIIFKEELDFTFQIEEIEKIPLETLLDMSEKEIKMFYASLEKIEKHRGTPGLIKLLLARGMHRIDPLLAGTIRHLMPREGPRALEKNSPTGFWEICLLNSKK